MKLSPSAIALFLRSPRAYYYRYIERIEPAFPSADRFDHHKLFGIEWSKNVARFYAEQPMLSAEEVLRPLLQGWVQEKQIDRLSTAFDNLVLEYPKVARPDDGARKQSEVWVESDKLCGVLDGWNPETHQVHEVKTTCRVLSPDSYVWLIQNSIQCRLYCAVAEAARLLVEFAFKDPPQAIYRAPVMLIHRQERRIWLDALNEIARDIQQRQAYFCHPQGCSIVSARMNGVCPYKPLCAGECDLDSPLYKKVEHVERREQLEVI